MLDVILMLNLIMTKVRSKRPCKFLLPILPLSVINIYNKAQNYVENCLLPMAILTSDFTINYFLCPK